MGLLWLTSFIIFTASVEVQSPLYSSFSFLQQLLKKISCFLNHSGLRLPEMVLLSLQKSERAHRGGHAADGSVLWWANPHSPSCLSLTDLWETWLPFLPPPSHPTLAHLLPFLPLSQQGLQGLIPPHPDSSQNLVRIIAPFLVVLDGSEVKGPEISV